MSMTLPVIITIIVLAILLVFFFVGMKKGLLRILFTTFSFVVTIALSALLTQPLADFLKESTFVGPAVENAITAYVESEFNKQTNTGSDESIAKSSAKGRQTDDSSKDEQAADEDPGEKAHQLKRSELERSFLNSLALPEFVKNNIRTDNTLEKYRDLGVKTFEDYISSQLTTVSVKAIAFIVLAILIYIFLRVIFQILKVIQRIPILRGINRLLGGLIGLAEGLLIIWGLCVFIMIFSGSAFGTSCMQVIRESSVLSFIYDHNLLANAIHAVFGLL